ncbi:hypothetical protein GCM10023156_11580 [Novipirellula rosea]|uniref:Uncharacterized protein n=1 Tax=Novipirellula rosea TaxID=1031540 RepID=A0ABP8MFX4_9BACT
MQQKQKRGRSPFDCILDADVVRWRLQSVLTEASRLRFLLRVASEVESGSPLDEPEAGHV